MLIVDLLVDATVGHKIISFMDDNARYIEEDILKTTFRCPGAIDLYELVVMAFDHKGNGATYHQPMNGIYHDFIG
jgi:hypothetical protein